MTFQVFERRVMPYGKDPLVTIRKRGQLALNPAAYELLGKPAAAELLYDQAEKIIGLRGVDASSEHGFLLRANGQGRVISAGLFTRHYGIDVAVSVRRPCCLDDGVLCVDLKEPGTVVTSNAARQ